MVSLVDGIALLGALAGCVLLWLAYDALGRRDRPGRRWLVVFTAVTGLGCVVTGILLIFPSLFTRFGLEKTFWAQTAVLWWILMTYPWFVFSLKYTGTRPGLRKRTVALLGVPHLGIGLQFALSAAEVSTTLLSIIGSLIFLYVLSLVIGGAYLLVQTTYGYGHLSVGQGISLAAVPLGTLVVWNTMSFLVDSSEAAAAGAFATGALLAVAGMGTALRRYDLLETTPAAGTLGEQALTRETDDLMFVVTDAGRIAQVNETAVETLDLARDEALGDDLSAVVGHDTESLRESETVTLQTTAGTRQYDPLVSTVDDPGGDRLGAMISLRDVTERELREQRLAVLNRVLRHNLRNEADVVKGHAETLDGADADHVASIIDAADSIAALGQQAHEIDQYVSESTVNETVDLAALVEEVLERVDANDSSVSVSVDLPSSATVVTSRRALASALESALDNAVRYADETVSVTATERADGYEITITDDGPGIPEWELESLDTGTETALEHSTGLGLWQLKWAVMALNGELSFDTRDGTTVRITVPDRGSADSS